MRESGILMPVSSLPGPYGIGCFGAEALKFVDFLADAGQHIWQLLPLSPTGYGDSPYQSCSAFAGNPYFIDLDALKADGLLTAAQLKAEKWGDDPLSVDYGTLYTSRYKVLRTAYAAWREKYAGLHGCAHYYPDDYYAFALANDSWLNDYALYMALKTANGMKSWTEWPREYRLRDAAALAKFAAEQEEEIGFWKFLQYEFATQWKKVKGYANAKGVKILGDIPIYVSADSVGCYPANHLLKAQFMEQMGRFEDACEVYKSYAHINDSIRSAELDEQLSKYTVQFEVDKLEHDKLELRAEVNRNLFITSVIVGCLVLILLIVITFYYMRSLSLNRKLDAANKAVIKASHMKSSFIQHITHEIRTPLNSIIGFSSLMAAGGLTQEEMEEYARQMESSNAYLLDLVNNVIDIADMDSQTDDIPKKPVSVDACCQECLGLIRQNLKEGIKLQYMPSSTPVEVCTVEIWMKRVLLGLLNNANKFTESGFICLSYAEDKPNRLVRFIIEDSGPGIDENYRDSIFERFAKVDAFTQGTGLGLSIIRQIMELVDGNVYLDTSYAGGARFVVEWPQ